MNSDTAPSLSKPPSRKIRPAASVAAETSTMYRPASARASGATSAASIAAEDEVDVTASWREVPNIAYTNMPSIAAYKPT